MAWVIETKMSVTEAIQGVDRVNYETATEDHLVWEDSQCGEDDMLQQSR